MKCPNCDKEMECVIFKAFDFGDFDSEDPYHFHEKYICSDCGIKRMNNNWTIPKEFLPTEKQIKTILFINYHLKINKEAITKHQCYEVIKKNLQDAILAKKHRWDESDMLYLPGDFY